MAINKVEYGTNTLIDLTGDTVIRDALTEGYTAHGADGKVVEGANPYKKAETDEEIRIQNDLINQIVTALDGKGVNGGGGSDDIEIVEQATPVIEVDYYGKITASAKQEEGYVQAGTKTAEKQLNVATIAEYTPTNEDQTIPIIGRYVVGNQVIKGDANLLPDNIKKGVSIFDVEGTFEGSSTGIDTSDATATAEDMAEGATAYVNGEKVTGNIAYAPTGIIQSPDIKKTNTGPSNYPVIYLTYGEKASDKKYIAGGGNAIKIYTKLENFGDATPEDVAEGKTFTSASGLKVTGTHSGGYASGDIVKAKETTNFTIISGYSNLSVKYSSIVVDNNGELALGGTTNSVSVSSASDFDVIKGKYIEKSSSGAKTIYYIPEDATITQTGSTYSKSYVASKANQIFVLG